ncbi:MAG: SUMF1/EgtB/PvdO family nonheme iron enzyme [Leptolyngbya sp. Prado105]|jgi:formylglycine-generating enzyme required for sulfatase activity|nr:SUMF1/EgtB/PvdO family nonheme iron enzyme [Leptolyngbya sp. Prado105]
MVRAVKVFVSYAHEDEPLRIELEKHLGSLRRSQAIAQWHDRKIEPGTEWAKEIDRNLQEADVILLLISPAFIHSEYCSSIELTQAMARHEAGTACVIPIILRPADWENEPFAKLQAYPKNAKPVTTWENRDEAFLDIVRGIRAAVTRIAERLSQAEIDRSTASVAEKIVAAGQAEEQYRDEVLFCLKQDHGEISPESRIVLEVSRNRLKLSAARASEIESEVSQPFQEFRTAATALIKSPQLSPRIQTLLDRVQQRVKLSNEDASSIVNQILSTITPAKAAKPVKPRLLSTFKFQSVTVNDRGVEIDRPSGQASYYPEELAEGVFLDMVLIPGGSFWMGAAEDEVGASSQETPRHQVTIKPFFISKFAITEMQWNAVATLPNINRVLKVDPSNDHQPIRNISWEDAIEFCDRLAQQTRNPYRLPSEAEWEYACRAGTTTPFHFGKTITSELANYNGNDSYANAPKGLYREKTIEVGSFPPNAFGLYDMHGNVREWCADPWHDSYQNAPTEGQVWESVNDTSGTRERENNRRVLRGGSWLDLPGDCRSATRNYVIARFRSYFFGFRIACNAPSDF